MTPTNAVPFEVSCSGKAIKCDSIAGRSARQLLLIHGAGASERRRFAPLRRALQMRGIGSTAFDCIGHGETGGAMHESSLASRTCQAEAVIDARMDARIDALQSASPLAIVGTSMGAYNAIKLSERRKVEALVLVVPGVYAPEAYELPFGAGFTAVIRKERSWDSTDAWRILEEFEGRLLVVAAEHDAVIPPEIPERLLQAARKAAWRKLHIVPGAEHNRLFSLLAERPAEFDVTMNLIIDCLEPAS